MKFILIIYSFSVSHNIGSHIVSNPGQVNIGSKREKGRNEVLLANLNGLSKDPALRMGGQGNNTTLQMCNG